MRALVVLTDVVCSLLQGPVLVYLGGSTKNVLLISKENGISQPLDAVDDIVNGSMTNGVHSSDDRGLPEETSTSKISLDCVSTERGSGGGGGDGRGEHDSGDEWTVGDAPERDACASPQEMVFSGGVWRRVVLKDFEEGENYTRTTEYGEYFPLVLCRGVIIPRVLR